LRLAYPYAPWHILLCCFCGISGEARRCSRSLHGNQSRPVETSRPFCGRCNVVFYVFFHFFTVIVLCTSLPHAYQSKAGTQVCAAPSRGGMAPRVHYRLVTRSSGLGFAMAYWPGQSDHNALLKTILGARRFALQPAYIRAVCPISDGQH
jgi:hypothetical protein